MASKPRVVVVGGGFAGCGVAHDKQLTAVRCTECNVQRATGRQGCLGLTRALRRCRCAT